MSARLQVIICESELAAIHAATEHQFPTGDISEVLAEIESGYLGASE